MSFWALQWLPRAFQDNGQPSLLLWLVVLSVLGLALLFGGLAVRSFAASVKQTESSNSGAEIQPNGAESYPISARVTAMSSLGTIKSIGKLALVLAIGFGAGWVTRRQTQDVAAWKQLTSEYQKAYSIWAARQPNSEQVNLKGGSK